MSYIKRELEDQQDEKFVILKDGSRVHISWVDEEE